MKKTLPVICSLLLSVSSLSAEESAINNNVIESEPYKSSLELFKDKNFTKSLESFEKLSDKYPQNSTVTFYYARSAYEVQNYELAFTLYDKILINNPSNHRVRLELARTLFMMRSYKQAKEELTKVLASPIPPVVRKNVEKFMQAVEAKDKKYFLNKVAIFGFGWDDNVGNNSGDEYIGNLPLNDNGEKSGSYLKTILVGNLIVPVKSNPKLSWESLGVGYIQEQLQHHSSDIWLTSLTTGIGYTNKNYKNLTSVNYDHIWIGSESNMYYYGISNNLKYKIDKNTLAFDMKFKKKQMVKSEDRDQNTNISEFGLKYTIPVKAKELTYDLSTTYTKEKQKNYSAYSQSNNKSNRKYKLSVKKDYPKDYSLTLGYQKEFAYYKGIDAANTTNRKDTIDNISLKLDKKLDNSKQLSFEFDIKNADSTIGSLYTYDKHSLNVNYTILF